MNYAICYCEQCHIIIAYIGDGNTPSQNLLGQTLSDVRPLLELSILTITVTLLILFLAAFIKAVLGFGESLVAIPLLTLVIGVQAATPLVSLIAATVTLLIMTRSWQKIDLGATWRLTLSAAIGIPAGIWGLSRFPSIWLVIGLGVMLILTGLFYLTRPTLPPLQDQRWAYLFGFLSGIFGGAYSMASPPTLVYSTMRRWSPEQFRVTLQSFFLPVSAMILIGHAAAGLWTSQVLWLYAISWPVMLVAFWAGNRFSQQLETALFERIIYVSLIILGGVLIYRLV